MNSGKVVMKEFGKGCHEGMIYAVAMIAPTNLEFENMALHRFFSRQAH
jgi:hypothetical protein